MHGPLRVDPSAAVAAIDLAFPSRCWLTPDEQQAFLTRLSTLGITGGAVYDGLVGEAARRANLTLLTRDARAQWTYEVIGVRFELVE